MIEYTDEQHDSLIRGHRKQLADAQATVEALQRERDEARRRVDELEAREVAVVLLRDELDAVREKAARLEAAYEKILLSRERLERELRGYPPVDNEGIPMVWQDPVGWVQRALNATTPENGVDSAGRRARKDENGDAVWGKIKN